MAQEEKLRVFMDVSTGGCFLERMVFELFYELAPFSAENFRLLCTGEKVCSPKTGNCMCYANCFFHKVKKGSSYLKAGAFCYESGEDGKCIESIYGPHWPMFEFNDLKHNKRGLLSISHEDQLASCSNFLITLKANEGLDRSNVVFGILTEGIGTLGVIEEYCSRIPIQIQATGLLRDSDRRPSDVIVRSCWPPQPASEDPAKKKMTCLYGWE